MACCYVIDLPRIAVIRVDVAVGLISGEPMRNLMRMVFAGSLSLTVLGAPLARAEDLNKAIELMAMVEAYRDSCNGSAAGALQDDVIAAAFRYAYANGFDRKNKDQMELVVTKAYKTVDLWRAIGLDEACLTFKVNLQRGSK